MYKKWKVLKIKRYVENAMPVPQKIKNGTALWPSNFTSGYIYKETQSTNLKRYMHPWTGSSAG